MDEEIQYMGTRSAPNLSFTQSYPSHPHSPIKGIVLHLLNDSNRAVDQLVFMRHETSVVYIGRRPGSLSDTEDSRRSDSRNGRAMFRCAVVSRKHAKIVFVDSGHVYLIDLNSHHGTHIRKPTAMVSVPVPAETPTPLTHNDVVTFGKTVGKDRHFVRPITVRVEVLFDYSTPTRSPVSFSTGIVTTPSAGKVIMTTPNNVRTDLSHQAGPKISSPGPTSPSGSGRYGVYVASISVSSSPSSTSSISSTSSYSSSSYGCSSPSSHDSDIEEVEAPPTSKTASQACQTRVAEQSTSAANNNSLDLNPSTESQDASTATASQYIRRQLDALCRLLPPPPVTTPTVDNIHSSDLPSSIPLMTWTRRSQPSPVTATPTSQPVPHNSFSSLFGPPSPYQSPPSPPPFPHSFEFEPLTPPAPPQPASASPYDDRAPLFVPSFPASSQSDTEQRNPAQNRDIEHSIATPLSFTPSFSPGMTRLFTPSPDNSPFQSFMGGFDRMYHEYQDFSETSQSQSQPQQSRHGRGRTTIRSDRPSGRRTRSNGRSLSQSPMDLSSPSPSPSGHAPVDDDNVVDAVAAVHDPDFIAGVSAALDNPPAVELSSILAYGLDDIVRAAIDSNVVPDADAQASGKNIPIAARSVGSSDVDQDSREQSVDLAPPVPVDRVVERVEPHVSIEDVPEKPAAKEATPAQAQSVEHVYEGKTMEASDDGEKISDEQKTISAREEEKRQILRRRVQEARDRATKAMMDTTTAATSTVEATDTSDGQPIANPLTSPVVAVDDIVLQRLQQLEETSEGSRSVVKKLMVDVVDLRDQMVKAQESAGSRDELLHVQSVHRLVEELQALTSRTTQLMESEISRVKLASGNALSAIANQIPIPPLAPAPSRRLPLHRRLLSEVVHPSGKEMRPINGLKRKRNISDDDSLEENTSDKGTSDDPFGTASTSAPFTMSDSDCPPPSKRARKIMHTVLKTATAVTVGAVAAWSALAFA